MVLDASCHISYRSNAPIPAIMILRPRSGYAQWITQEEYAFEPHAPAVEYTDNFGNLCQRVLIPKGNFEVRCSCRAHTADVVDVDPKAGFVPVQELPESAVDSQPQHPRAHGGRLSLPNTGINQVRSGATAKGDFGKSRTPR
jgi:Bacterial transglutaminase-like N-terminal region